MQLSISELARYQTVVDNLTDTDLLSVPVQLAKGRVPLDIAHLLLTDIRDQLLDIVRRAVVERGLCTLEEVFGLPEAPQAEAAPVVEATPQGDAAV